MARKVTHFGISTRQSINQNLYLYTMAFKAYQLEGSYRGYIITQNLPLKLGVLSGSANEANSFIFVECAYSDLRDLLHNFTRALK